MNLWAKIVAWFKSLQIPKPVVVATIDTSGVATLRRGESGGDVMKLQARLKELKFFKGSVKGNFLGITEEAVKSFQRAYGLTVDGIVGPKTWAALATPVKQDPQPPEMQPVGDFAIPSIDIKSPRKISKKLEAAIDEMVMKTNAARLKNALAKKDANTIVGLAAEALSSMNIREKSGNNDGIWVEEIQAVTGNSRGDAWCMSGYQAGVAYAEKKTGIISKIYRSASCASVRKNSSSLAVALTDAKYGDSIIWVYKSGLGHVGTFEGWIKFPTVAILNECNTTKGKVGDVIVREGGGAYQTERTLSTTDSAMRVGMVVRPF